MELLVLYSAACNPGQFSYAAAEICTRRSSALHSFFKQGLIGQSSCRALLLRWSQCVPREHSMRHSEPASALVRYTGPTHPRKGLGFAHRNSSRLVLMCRLSARSVPDLDRAGHLHALYGWDLQQRDQTQYQPGLLRLWIWAVQSYIWSIDVH